MRFFDQQDRRAARNRCGWCCCSHWPWPATVVGRACRAGAVLAGCWTALLPLRPGVPRRLLRDQCRRHAAARAGRLVDGERPTCARAAAPSGWRGASARARRGPSMSAAEQRLCNIVDEVCIAAHMPRPAGDGGAARGGASTPSPPAGTSTMRWSRSPQGALDCAHPRRAAGPGGARVQPHPRGRHAAEHAAGRHGVRPGTGLAASATCCASAAALGLLLVGSAIMADGLVRLVGRALAAGRGVAPARVPGRCARGAVDPQPRRPGRRAAQGAHAARSGGVRGAGLAAGGAAPAAGGRRRPAGGWLDAHPPLDERIRRVYGRPMPGLPLTAPVPAA